MMIELPNTKIPASRINPKKIILFSKPKVGKTEALSALDNCLLIDLENGSEFVDAMKINVLDIAQKQNQSPISVLKEVIESIKEANKKAGKFVYKYGAIDTVSASNLNFITQRRINWMNSGKLQKWTILS
jgi:hypothetical protein